MTAPADSTARDETTTRDETPVVIINRGTNTYAFAPDHAPLKPGATDTVPKWLADQLATNVEHGNAVIVPLAVQAAPAIDPDPALEAKVTDLQSQLSAKDQQLADALAGLAKAQALLESATAPAPVTASVVVAPPPPVAPAGS